MSSQTIERPEYPPGTAARPTWDTWEAREYDLIRITDLDGNPLGPDGGLVVCSECGEPMPICPDLCGTLGGSLESGPPPVRRRPFRIGPDGRVAA